MRKTNLLTLGSVFLFISQPAFGQGMGEYGRLLGGAGQKNSTIVPRRDPPKMTAEKRSRANLLQATAPATRCHPILQSDRTARCFMPAARSRLKQSLSFRPGRNSCP